MSFYTKSLVVVAPLLLLVVCLIPQTLQNLFQFQQQATTLPSSSSNNFHSLPQIAPPPSSLLNAIEDLQRAALVQQYQAQQTLMSQLLPGPQMRPNFTVNIRDFSRQVSDDIRIVSERTSCTKRIGDFYENEGKFQQLDAIKLRDNVLNQINALLSQHKAAVSGIVMEAEKAALAHQFVKNLTVNYTDVHRVRNELDTSFNQQNNNLLEYPNDYTTNQFGPSSGSGTGDKPQFTSISGGTPVPGPVEWQTPVKAIVMQVNRNFGDIPVNTSMSAVHLPLPVYPGLPEIMNGIAWTERLDNVFRRNLLQFMHVHHQYYGDTLGFMRTFPAHKWRIARNEPDLFDARTRPWYIAGAATPKDVVIIVDTSGSMTGLRREIAKGVVFEILDTLTINDHFSVLRFSETVTPVGLPRCNLRTPRFASQLREQCRSSHRGDLQRPLVYNQDQQPALGLSMDNPVGGRRAGPANELQIECSAWRRQWDGRGQYLRDNPSIAIGQNGSYLTDDQYDQSIANVTLDIRDAYLLPATSRNIRYLKSNFSMPTAGIANFTRALMAGFELLQAYNRTNDLGSQCNQAIMLITDAAQSSYMEVFNRYNYPGSPIRLFTYMIGREVGDIKPLKEMACQNRGYYTHVINLSEVREQVQKYLAVMARPLVLAHNHPVTWTNAYGDETHQVLTDWVLELKRRERARIMLNEERERLNEANSSDVINTELTNIAEYDELPLVDEVLRDRIICEDARDDPESMDLSLEGEIDPLGYNDLGCHWAASRRADLLTSVVKPVFDQRNTSIFFERTLSKNVWHEHEIRLKNAQLLGVASVDLRVADMIRAAPSHLLGPNGYSILLGQNGFIMHHPNFYALLEDPFDKQSKILKPYFSSVDLTHIEQVYVRNDTDSAKRRNEEMKLLKLREAAVNRSIGTETITVKRSIDCRRRPYIRSQTFYYGPIKDTPYSFMVALPESYGLNRVVAKLQIDRDTQSYLQPGPYDLWTVHPEYRYCEKVLRDGKSSAQQSNIDQQTNGQQLHLNDSLTTLIELLNLTSSGKPYELELEDLTAISGSSTSHNSINNDRINPHRQRPFLQNGQPATNPRFVCDKELFGSLLFDAKATHESFVANDANGRAGDYESCAQTSAEMRTKLAQIYGLEMSFVATRSGLTRTLVFDGSARIKKLAKLFIERHDKAVDEAWYQRTVDWNLRFNEEATIITVPYNAYVRLIAKLRQRITQRHPAVNDTRSNCDASLVEESAAAAAAAHADDEDLGEQQQQAANSGPTTGGTTIESSSGIVQLMTNPQQATQMQADDPNVLLSSAGNEQQAMQQYQQQAPGDSSNVGANLNDTSNDSEPQLESSFNVPKINYNDYSSFDFLDLLTNSSVHISATQSVIVNKSKKQHRVATAVTGQLYDYAIFARKFLNSTSLIIRHQESSETTSDQTDSSQGTGASPALAPIKVDICPNGECPTQCGLRNDTIDCLLVDNNGYIVVGEELPHIGRSLVDYDEKLMMSLINKRVFHQVIVTDYQAICQAVPDAKPTANLGASSLALLPSSASSSLSSVNFMTNPIKLELVQTLVANFATALVWTVSTLYSAFLLKSAAPGDDLFGGDPSTLLGRLQQWQRSAILAEAQTATANQSLLALLPNKTFLRPCERTQLLYETRPSSDPNKLAYSDKPEFFLTKCNCSAWYVFDFVPKTNLVMLIVNTTSACRRCESQPGALSPAAPVVSLSQMPPLSEFMLPSANPSGLASQPPAWSGRSAAEEQVCSMLERDSQLYVQKPASCLSHHPDESSIHICGAGTRVRPANGAISYLFASLIVAIIQLLMLS